MPKISNHEAGKSYEDFVESVYRAILEAERLNGNIGPIALERRKKIISKSQTPAEIDIYWEYTVAGITHRVAIECRNYNKKVSLPGVRDFARKISDISGLKGLMVSKKGFSDHAITEAKADNIDLLIVREHEDRDWEGYFKGIDFQLNILEPCVATKVDADVDKEWAAHTGYKRPEDRPDIPKNLVVIEDKKTGFKTTLLELEENSFFEEKGDGNHRWEKDFDDGWIHFGERPVKIHKAKIDYVQRPVSVQKFSIDFGKYVLAVLEYISGKDGKFVIMANGEKKIY